MLEATVEELRTVALEAGDASGYFPAMYARVTQHIDDAAAAGDFANAAGMIAFAEAFAGWYLRPRSGAAPVPGCWQAAWDVADDRGLLIVQHLLLGINAHVNHDLPQVVVELADGRGDLSGMRPDFDAVNLVLADTMPEVIRDLGRASRWVNLAVGLGGGRLFNFSLTAARDQAWRFATAQYPLDPPDRRRRATDLDELVRVLAYLVTRPTWPINWLVPLARRLENDDPVEVTRQLLGPLA
jgi:Family of unknown function (DUF5995)